MASPVPLSPPVGLGTWKLDPEPCARVVREALELGYRHVDTAQLYDNETGVGEGIRRSSVPRDDVFLATKVWIDELGRDGVLESTRASLDRLGTDYVDLLYVHWPADAYDPEETLSAFAELRDEGLVRHVGVSNFTPELLDEARAACPAPIVANQVEMHPLLQQEELRAHCAERDVRVVAYSPFVHGDAFDVPEVREVAADRRATEAQVVLAWFRHHGVLPIPKASGLAHLRDNWDGRDVELTAEEIARIDGIDRERRISDGDIAPDW